MVNIAKFHRKNVYFDNQEGRNKFVSEYDMIFSNGGNRTNRMWIPEDHEAHYHDERYGGDYYPLHIVCDVRTWKFITAFQEFKRKTIIIRNSFGKRFEKTINIYKGAIE